MPDSGGAALITGAASGMGAAFARHVVEHGGRVVLVDRDAGPVRALADELGPKALAVAADVADESSAAAATAAGLERFGSIDRYFLNAGIGSATPLIDETVEGFDRIIAVDLRGVFLGLRAALRHARDSGRPAAVVVTASTAGLSGSDLAAYSAAKHGAIALVRTAAVEGAPLGVRVNAIAPGSIGTPLMAAMEARLGGGPRAAALLHATTPLGRAQGRYGTAEEVAAVVDFLLGPAASWITGTVVPVDGGVLATDPYRLPETGP
ncbi:SDR family NAD(P)-dependent oxidoreductase [uncultured Amnibacterium sp.]|uniref:SDR family NAD(P)-dependent oxidoreductase n=1 Tax=uncultured Amnibacterium sp. TaxID=1631851 RepID=UPI0035CA6D4E